MLLTCFLIPLKISAAEDFDLVTERKVEPQYDLINEGYEDSKYNNVFDFDSSGLGNDTNKKERAQDYKDKNLLRLSDSYFAQGTVLTLRSLLIKICLIVFILLGVLFAVKRRLSGTNVGRTAGLVDELAQKFAGNFPTLPGGTLKLKQSLVLTPGQNVYLVEVDGKKLLLGGTHQGGVQFLTDLSLKNNSKTTLDFKQIEECQNLSKNNFPFITQEMKEPLNQNKQGDIVGMPSSESVFNMSSSPPSPGQVVVENNAVKNSLPQSASEEKENILTVASTRQPFRRRTNFRRSLLAENIKSSDGLIKAR